MPGIDSFAKSVLHFDGTEGSTTFTDEIAGRSWTANGTAYIDTGNVKFGTASYQNGGGNGHISHADHADFDVGSGEFTIDFWYNHLEQASIEYIISQNDSSATAASTSFSIYDDASNRIVAKVVSGTTSYTITSTAISGSTWHHIALVRDNSANLLRLFIDGVADGTVDVTGVTVNDSSNEIAIGRQGENTSGTNNYNTLASFDEFRFSKGIARWVTGFTPPTAAYEVIPGFDVTSALGITASVLAPADVTDNTMLPSALSINANLPTPYIFGGINNTPSALSINATVWDPVAAATPDLFVSVGSALSITSSLLASNANVVISISLTAELPALTLTASMTSPITLEQTLPALTLTATMKAGQMYTMSGKLKPLTLVARMGMSMSGTLPALTLSSTLTQGGLFSVSRYLPALTLSSSMTTGRSMSLSADLLALELAANLVNGNILTLSKTLPALTLEGAATSGNRLSLSKTLPVATLSSTLSMSENLTMTATLPPFELEAYMDNYLDRYI